MFAIDCLKANGTHLGTCIDRFYFGSCCQLEDKLLSGETEILDNSIDHNDTPTQKTDGATLPPSLSKVTFPSKTKPSSPEVYMSPSVNQLYTTSTLRTTSKIPLSSVKPWSKKPIVNISTSAHATKIPEVTTEISYKLSTFQTVQSSDHNDSNLSSTEHPRTTTSPITKGTVADAVVTEKPTRRPITRPTTTHRTTVTHVPRPTSTSTSQTHRPRPKPSRPTGKPTPSRRPISKPTSNPTQTTGRPTTVKRPNGTRKPTVRPVHDSKPNVTSTTHTQSTSKPVDTTKPYSTSSHRPTSGSTRPSQNHTRPTRPHKPITTVVLLDTAPKENTTSAKPATTAVPTKGSTTTPEPFLTTSYVETTTVKDIDAAPVTDASNHSKKPEIVTTTTSVSSSGTSTSSFFTTEKTESEKTTIKATTLTTRQPILEENDFATTTQKIGLVTWTNVEEDSVTSSPVNDTKGKL